MSNKVIHVLYNDDDILMDAVKQTRAAHHHIEHMEELHDVRLARSVRSDKNIDVRKF